jgi:hypothetical protein
MGGADRAADARTLRQPCQTQGLFGSGAALSDFVQACFIEGGQHCNREQDRR